MVEETQNAWGIDIRRYVSNMLGLVILFVLVVAAYRTWFDTHAQQLAKEIHQYHLSSAAHYYKAQEMLRKVSHELPNIQADMQNVKQDKNMLMSNRTQKELLDQQRLSWWLVVAMQQIDLAIQLHYRFEDTQTKVLTERLAKLADYFNSSSGKPLYSANNISETQAITNALLLNLYQLALMHTHAHEDALLKLQEKSERFSHSFYLLLLVIIFSVSLSTRRGFSAISHIIAKHRAAEAKIEYQAFYDSLTALPNRLLSLDRLSQEISKAQRTDERVALLYIDLDDFKRVNDTLGHPVGDQLLQQTAQRLANAVRASDTVGRLGGDEFIVILSGVAQAAVLTMIVEKLIHVATAPYHVEGRELVVTTSAGIALYPDDGTTANELLQKADSAMYHSKSMGRNTHSYFTQEMQQAVARRMAVEQAIHGALEREEFEVHFQPQYDLHTHKIIGAEALLRWHAPTLGPVSPDEFIPIAEQTGLIIELGGFVLDFSLKMAEKWRHQYDNDLRLSVNLSPSQFRDERLIDKIQHTIHTTTADYSALELEITEGVLISNNADIEQMLIELADLGISLALDDFGTGYSSLSYLRRFPFDVLKIDKSFVRDIEEDPKDQELINAAIQMAHSLRMAVVAEGIETEGQFERLATLGCDYGQGFLMSKPVTAEAMENILFKAFNNGESSVLESGIVKHDKSA